MIKNKIRYLTLFLIALLMFTGFRGRTLFVILAVLVVMPFFTIIYAGKMIRRMEVSVSFSKDMTGRRATNIMTVMLNNKVHMPNSGVTLTMGIANSMSGEKKSFKVDIPVEGYGKSSVDIKISADNCGFIYVSDVTVDLCDILNLHCFKRRKEVEARYMVIPSYVYAPSDKTAFRPEDDSDIVMHEVGEDTSEIDSIREYRAGDRMQRIHWKLTGKMDEMMVKEYAINYDVDVSLVCELVKNDAHICMDELLDALYSLMIELCDTNERYAFYFSNRNHNGTIAVSIASREDIIDAIAQLYYIEPYEQPALATALAKAQGIAPLMVLGWANGDEDPDKVLYEFDDKVVLVWE